MPDPDVEGTPYTITFGGVQQLLQRFDGADRLLWVSAVFQVQDLGYQVVVLGQGCDIQVSFVEQEIAQFGFIGGQGRVRRDLEQVGGVERAAPSGATVVEDDREDRW